MIYIWFFLALIIIIKAGNVFLDNSIFVARAFKIPEFVVGTVIAGIYTILPSTVIAVSSSAIFDAGLALGTCVGAAMFNIALALPMGILFLPPRLRFTGSLKQHSVILILLAASVVLVIQRTGGIQRAAGLSLILFGISYLSYSAKKTKASSVVCLPQGRLWTKLVILMISGIAVFVTAHILAECSQRIAASLHIPTMLAGIIFTAAGTATPSMVTCVEAFKKGAAEIAIGNALGAAILNLCFATGTAAAVNPIYVSIPPAFFTLCAVLCCAIYLYFSFLRRSRRLYRFDGVLLICMYIAFIITSAIMFSTR